ncbi:unnamed protein product [Strongylus vulgaris]|uniref:Uncharacterized protein n=1 Tax=Strongylus vulgaris TaxID=40348 RepID=A0A3P7IH05_STRVU|nr:unnamed protein product [Strongylus vulgaris]
MSIDMAHSRSRGWLLGLDCGAYFSREYVVVFLQWDNGV